MMSICQLANEFVDLVDCIMSLCISIGVDQFASACLILHADIALVLAARLQQVTLVNDHSISFQISSCLHEH